jgi:DNA-binding transcriptional MocR family regulator
VTAPPCDATGEHPVWPPEAVALWRTCFDASTTPPWPTPADGGEPRLLDALAAELRLNRDALAITDGVRSGAVPLLRGRARLHLEQPSFAGIERLARSLDVPCTRWSWDPPGRGGRGMPAVLSRPGPDSVTWLTSPNRNPDGRRLDEHTARRLTDLTAAGRLVVQNLVYDWLGPQAAARVPGAVLIGSFSKIAGGGVRLGWVCDTEYAHRARAERRGSGPPQPWQLAWALFLEQGGMGLLRVSAAERVASVARVVDEGLGIAPPTDWSQPPATYRLVELDAGFVEESVCRQLAEESVLVSPGAAFAASRPSVRLSLLRLDPVAAERVVEALGRFVSRDTRRQLGLGAVDFPA